MNALIGLLLCITFRLASTYQVPKPVRLIYINSLNDRWTTSGKVDGLAIPAEGTQSVYNYVLLTFWSCGNQVYDTVKMWDNLVG